MLTLHSSFSLTIKSPREGLVGFDAHSVLSWLLVNGRQALRADLSNGIGQIMVIGLEALKVAIVPTSLVHLSEEKKNLECHKE